MSLGHLGQYAVVERSVQLVNSTSDPVQIRNVSVSCGCTTTKAPDLIPPHGEAPLTIHFRALDRIGPVQEEVNVQFEGQEANVTIPVSGTVTREIAMSRSLLDLTAKPSSIDALTLTRLDGKPLKVACVNASSHLRADIQTVSPNVTRLAVFRVGPRLTGAHSEDVTLRLNDPLVPTLTIPVSWTIAGSYHCLPQYVNFGSVVPGTVVEQRVRISGPDAAHLRVVSAPKGWTTRLQSAKSGAVSLILRGSSKGGLLHSSIVLATGASREPTIAVPIYAVFETAAGVCSGKPLGDNSSAH